METFQNYRPIVNIITPEIKKRLASLLISSISAIVIGGMATAFAADEESLAPEGAAGKFEFTSKIYFANEQSKNAIIKVARKGGSNGVVSVNYATAAFENRDTVDPTINSAAEGKDYATTEGYLIWGNGDNEIKTFKVPLFDDVDEEGDETVNLVLNSPTGAALGDQKTAKLKIADDECHGVFSIEARKLYLPLSTVPLYDPISRKPTEDVVVFEATFTFEAETGDFIIDVTDPKQFNFVKQMKNVDKLEADCYAKYDWKTRTFQIPYVDLPSILGPNMVFRVNIEETPFYEKEGLAYLQIGDYQYLYIYDSE